VHSTLSIEWRPVKGEKPNYGIDAPNVIRNHLLLRILMAAKAGVMILHVI
jgi:hypothetical protein